MKYNDFCTQTTNNLFQIIEEHGSLLTWRKTWDSTGSDRLPEGANGIYGGGNLFNLLHSQQTLGLSSHRWMTFKQINELGGSVKKGAKATRVYFFAPAKPREKGAQSSDDSQSEFNNRFIFRTYNVFNLEHTTLLNDATLEDLNHSFDAPHLLGTLGLSVEHYENSACYNPAQDFVKMPNVEKFENSDDYLAVLLHEIVHATGHEQRLDRKKITDYSYAEEELVAEIGAFLLCTHFNIKSNQMNHASYVQSWKQELTEKQIMRATSNASKAFSYLANLTTAESIAA